MRSPPDAPSTTFDNNSTFQPGTSTESTYVERDMLREQNRQLREMLERTHKERHELNRPFHSSELRLMNDIEALLKECP